LISLSIVNKRIYDAPDKFTVFCRRFNFKYKSNSDDFSDSFKYFTDWSDGTESGLKIIDGDYFTLVKSKENEWEIIGSAQLFNRIQRDSGRRVVEMYSPESGVVLSSLFDSTGLGIGSQTGYALCNGNNNTPDLRSRFIVGYNPTDTDYNVPGKLGGQKSVTLTESQMPIHNHGWTGQNGTGWPDGSGDSTGAGTGNSYPRTSQILNKGGGQPHENRPPYYTMIFRMKL
jgi:hypothetical protein